MSLDLIRSPAISDVLEASPEWDISITSPRTTHDDDAFEIVFRSRRDLGFTICHTWLAGSLREAVDFATMQARVCVAMSAEELWG